MAPKRNLSPTEVAISTRVFNILADIGRNNEPGTADTPDRVAKFLVEFCTRPPIGMTLFEEPNADQMVTVGPISFSSLCEHHMLPFFGEAHIAYIPSPAAKQSDKGPTVYVLAGVSKLPRTVEHFAAGLNNQERITAAIGRYLTHECDLKPQGVAVFMKASHTCMTIRGVKQACACTTTQYFSGPFKNDPATRAEFLASVRCSK